MTNSVLLRNVTKDDLSIFYEQQLDPEATAMAAFPPRDYDSFMIHWTTIMANDAVILKSILCDDRVAGNVVAWKQDEQWLIGYWLGKDFWGRGIATSALNEFVKIIKIRPLYAYVANHNIASQKVLEKCGFTIVEKRSVIEEDAPSIEELVWRLDS